MIDQFFIAGNCQNGARPLFPLSNNNSMIRSPIQLAKQLTGYTGERLAEELGISAAHLSRMSNNKRRITTQLIERLAVVSGKSADEFYKLLGSSPEDVENAAQAVTGHPYNQPLMLNPEIFDKAYERARVIESTLLGGRGSNADFAVIFERVYADILEAEGD